MKISILLPYKENFSKEYAGAVSLLQKDIIPLSRYKKFIKIYGSTNFKRDILKKNYVNLKISNFFFQSKTNTYVKNFIKHEIKKKSDLIEIHNRPIYVNKVHKINKNIILYFHNDPLQSKGSISINERINLLNKTKKIIFISKWVKKRFLKGINKKNLFKNKFDIIQHSTNKKKVDFKKKEKIILFVGRLNKSKGYDIFGKAILNVLKKYPDWKSVVIGDEPREKIIFNHKNFKLLGFKKNNIVSKWFLKSEICVVCSRWQEPFGRTALEASSSGCAVIVTKKGGLPEASPKAIKLKNLTVSNLQKKLFKLIQNKKFKKSLQSKIYNNFYLTNEYISNKVDEYRSFLIKN